MNRALVEQATHPEALERIVTDGGSAMAAARRHCSGRGLRRSRDRGVACDRSLPAIRKLHLCEHRPAGDDPTRCGRSSPDARAPGETPPGGAFGQPVTTLKVPGHLVKGVPGDAACARSHSQPGRFRLRPRGSIIPLRRDGVAPRFRLMRGKGAQSPERATHPSPPHRRCSDRAGEPARAARAPGRRRGRELPSVAGAPALRLARFPGPARGDRAASGGPHGPAGECRGLGRCSCARSRPTIPTMRRGASSPRTTEPAFLQAAVPGGDVRRVQADADAGRTRHARDLKEPRPQACGHGGARSRTIG